MAVGFEVGAILSGALSGRYPKSDGGIRVGRSLGVSSSSMRVRRTQLAAVAFVILVLAGELAGRWTVVHLPLIGQAPRRHHGGVDAWPVLVILTKLGMALLLARIAWRVVKAHRVALVGERLAHGVGVRHARPVPAVALSSRVWFMGFTAMSVLYLIPTSSGELMSGGWPLLTPWLHTQALPVFAVLAVVIAILWRTISRWLAALEHYADAILGLAQRRAARGSTRWPFASIIASPRSRFGVCFEGRPPPATA